MCNGLWLRYRKQFKSGMREREREREKERGTAKQEEYYKIEPQVVGNLTIVPANDRYPLPSPMITLGVAVAAERPYHTNNQVDSPLGSIQSSLSSLHQAIILPPIIILRKHFKQHE